MGDIVSSFRRGLRRAPALGLHTRIALERVLADLTVPHCARAMGWRHNQWQRLENNERQLTDDELVRVADILGCTVARLRGEQAQVVPGFLKRGRPRLELAA